MVVTSSPQLVSSCTALSLSAYVPKGYALGRMNWICSPSDDVVCTQIASEVATNVVTATDITVSATAMKSAATQLSDLGEPLTGEVQIFAEAVLPGGRVLSRGFRNVSYDFTSGTKLLAQPSTTEYNLLNDYIRLSVVTQSCSPIPTPLARWQWSLVGTEDWTQVTGTGSTSLSLKFPVKSLPKVGWYTFRVTIAGSTSKVDFLVNLKGYPPPTAVLSAPVSIAPSCDFILDASGSTDPTNAKLNFTWSCSAADVFATNDEAYCKDLVSRVTTAQLLLPGNRLGTGVYNFSVTASRGSANDTASALVRIARSAGVSSPAVSMGIPAAKVSPQKAMTLNATVVRSGACTPPSQIAWWILPTFDNGTVDESNGTLVSRDVSTQTTVLVIPPFPLPYGQSYVLRLVLTDKTTTSWTAVDGLVFPFDSKPFYVAPPPLDGTCRIFPDTGNTSTTTFTLSSLEWVSDSLPLQHRFYWRSGGLNLPGVVDSDWTVLVSWSQATQFENLLLGEAGQVTARAEARDSLGSVSMAYGVATVVSPTVPPSEDEMLSALDAVLRGGNPFAALAAVNALAGTSTNNGGASAEFANKLLDVMTSSTALADPTPEAVGACSSAVSNVLNTQLPASEVQARKSRQRRYRYLKALTSDYSSGVANESLALETVPRSAMSVGVATKAATFVGTIAVAAGELDTGLELMTASTMLSSVDAMLGTVAGGASSGRALADEMTPTENLSGHLVNSTALMADAVMKGIAEGQGTTVEGGRGMVIAVSRAPTSSLTSKTLNVGSFSLPRFPAKTLKGRDTCSGDGGIVGVSNIKWSANPFAYASTFYNITGGEMPRPPGVTGEIEECCDLSPESVQSLNLRICGETVHLSNLSQNVTFSLAIPRILSDNESFAEVRVCQYFNETVQEWTSEGCTLVESYDDRIVCSCNHLSSFAAAYGTITSFIEDAVELTIICANVNVLSGEGLAMLFKGKWWYDRGALVLWSLVLITLIVAVLAWRHSRYTLKQLGVTREELLLSLSPPNPSVRKKINDESWLKMKRAAKQHDRSRSLAITMYYAQRLLVGAGADLEEQMMRSWMEGIIVAIAVRTVRMMAVSDLGLRIEDSEYVRRMNEKKAAEAAAARAEASLRRRTTLSFGRRSARVHAAPGDGGGEDESTSWAEPAKPSPQAAGRRGVLGGRGVRVHAAPGGEGEGPAAKGAGRGSSARGSTDSSKGPLVTGTPTPPAAAAGGKRKSIQEAEVVETTIARLKDSVETQLQQSQEELALGAWRTNRRNLWNVFKGAHPVARMMRLSLTIWWSFHVLALACSVFGTLMVSALFLQQSSVKLSMADFEKCKEGDFAINLARDIIVTIVGWIVARVPVTLLLRLHKRPLPRLEDPTERAALLRGKLHLDAALFVIGLLYVCLCILICASFLANVRPSDADHWLVSTLTLFVKSWLLLPLVIALVWDGFSRVLTKRPPVQHRAAESLRALLHTERSMEERQAREVEKEREAVADPRPPWMRNAKPVWGSSEGDSARDMLEFREWAQEWVSHNRPPGGMLSARVPEERPLPPPAPPKPPAFRALPPPLPPSSSTAIATYAVFTPQEMPPVMLPPERISIEEMCSEAEPIGEDPHFWEWAREWSASRTGGSSTPTRFPDSQSVRIPLSPPPPPPALPAAHSAQGQLALRTFGQAREGRRPSFGGSQGHDGRPPSLGAGQAREGRPPAFAAARPPSGQAPGVPSLSLPAWQRPQELQRPPVPGPARLPPPPPPPARPGRVVQAQPTLPPLPGGWR